MIFKNLTISNFGSIGEMELPLADQGLTLILGRNEDAPKADSNGAGKSLPLDAFTWALWGNTVRGFGSDEVVNNKVNRDCKVTVTLSDRNNDYEVTRYRRNKSDKEHKPNDLILMCNGTEVSGASVAATQDMVEEIVGLDFVTFCAMMPGAGISVASMTDSEVKGLLEKLLRTETLGKASEEARKRHRAHQSTIAVSADRLVSLAIAVSEVSTRITDLQEKENGYDDGRVEKLDEISTAVASLEQSKAAHDLVVETLPALATKKGEILTALEGSNALLDGFKNDISNTDKHYTSKTNKLNEDKIELSVNIRSAVAAVNTLTGFAGQCPACQQLIDEEHQAGLLKGWEEKERLLQIKLDTNVGSAAKTREKWVAEREEYLSLIGNETISRDHHQAMLLEADKELGKANEAEMHSKHIQQRIDELTTRKVSLESDANPYSSLLESEEVIFINKQQESEHLLLEIADQRKYEQILSFWVDSFSPQGIRSFMLEHVTPLLNRFAKKYADIVTSGEMEITFHTKDTLKSGKSKERFNIQVAQKHGGGSYASNSSGERARANLIIALALGDLAALRAEKTIPFRILDEPFESIDESGTEAIVTLLNQQKEQYNTVYVITHQESFKQLFPNKKTIVKKGGFSALEEE